MAKVPYWHLCQRLNNGLSRHLTDEKAGLPFMVRMLRTPVNLLGCTLEQLVQHIESQMHDGMTWGNFRRWHLDHFFPVAGVNVYDDTEVFAACNYRNLRPMWAINNLRKHDEVTEESLRHFRALCDDVRQPWHRLHVPHPCDACVAQPQPLTSDQILKMPIEDWRKWIEAQTAMAAVPMYGSFVPPSDSSSE